MTDNKAVSAKRAMKFARTFSETIEEDDDDAFPSEPVEEKEDPLSGRYCNRGDHSHYADKGSDLQSWCVCIVLSN